MQGNRERNPGIPGKKEHGSHVCISSRGYAVCTSDGWYRVPVLARKIGTGTRLLNGTGTLVGSTGFGTGTGEMGTGILYHEYTDSTKPNRGTEQVHSITSMH
jgi:hypothetical protein